MQKKSNNFLKRQYEKLADKNMNEGIMFSDLDELDEEELPN
jgi:hypothetical protein|tara:strand:- start:1306 stop:1428 length:123 start_codon:yes stop_codon:yes gene_type:complete